MTNGVTDRTTDHPAAAALADWWLFVRRPQYIAVSVIACLMTGFGGPFSTDDYLPLSVRLLYWTVIVGFSILLLTYLSLIAYRVALQERVHWALAAALAGAAGSPAILVVVAVMYSIFLSHAPPLLYWRTALEVLIPSVVINVIVNAYIALPPGYHDMRTHLRPIRPREAPASTSAPMATDEHSLFFDNLPEGLDPDVVSIRADNHYIDVRTRTGSARMLMRLRDAETALTGLPGLRVHRSWWVNLSHAQRLDTRSGGGGVLTLDTGETVPVSRAQIDAVRQALAAMDRIDTRV